MSVRARKQLAPRSLKWSEVEEKVAADMLLRGFKCPEVAAGGGNNRNYGKEAITCMLLAEKI